MLGLREGRRMSRFYSVNTSSGSSLRVCEELKVKLKAKGQTEVTSPDQCDYVLACCTISTRPGIDLQETVARCPDGKQVILVVLHHTYDRERFVTPMANQTSSNTLLSVDIMFYEGKMLECPHNGREFDRILRVVGYRHKPLNWKQLINSMCNWLVNHKVLLCLAVTVTATLWYFSNRDGSKKALPMDSASVWNYLPPV